MTENKRTETALKSPCMSFCETEVQLLIVFAAVFEISHVVPIICSCHVKKAQIVRSVVPMVSAAASATSSVMFRAVTVLLSNVSAWPSETLDIFSPVRGYRGSVPALKELKWVCT